MISRRYFLLGAFTGLAPAQTVNNARPGAWSDLPPSPIIVQRTNSRPVDPDIKIKLWNAYGVALNSLLRESDSLREGLARSLETWAADATIPASLKRMETALKVLRRAFDKLREVL